MTDDAHTHRWVFACGAIPAQSTGPEPEFTSRDELCILNTGDEAAELDLTVFHTDRDPVGPYRIELAPRRVCHVRINDLIDPEAVPLGVPYGMEVTSSRAVHVQLARLDTRRGGIAQAIVNGVAV
jgi:hypothetical protein